MKRKKMNLIFQLVIVSILTLGLSLAASADSLKNIKKRGYIRIAVANEIPYGYVTSSGKAEGFGPDVAKEVLKRMGIDDIQWTVTEFGSLIPALKANRVDIVAAEQNILPQRCQQVNFSEPNTSYGEGLLVKTGNPKNIHSYQDFIKNHNLKMGIVSGADQLDFAQELHIPGSQLVMLAANTDAVSAVATGRIDAYAATGLTAQRLAMKSKRVEQAEPFSDPIINGKAIRSWGGFTFNQHDTQLLKEFDKNLAAVQKTMFWSKTLKHYGLDQHSIDMVHKFTSADLCAGKNK